MKFQFETFVLIDLSIKKEMAEKHEAREILELARDSVIELKNLLS